MLKQEVVDEEETGAQSLFRNEKMNGYVWSCLASCPSPIEYEKNTTAHFGS